MLEQIVVLYQGFVLTWPPQGTRLRGWGILVSGEQEGRVNGGDCRRDWERDGGGIDLRAVVSLNLRVRM